MKKNVGGNENLFVSKHRYILDYNKPLQFEIRL